MYLNKNMILIGFGWIVSGPKKNKKKKRKKERKKSVVQ